MTLVCKDFNIVCSSVSNFLKGSDFLEKENEVENA